MSEKPMTHELREQIALRIKNKIDISDLIKDVCIKGENLSGAIISDFYRVNTDISDCNLSKTTIGNDKTIVTMIRTKMNNVNFEGAKFIGSSWIRHCKAQNCNFKNADVSKIDYQYTDFTGSTFCNAIIKIGTSTGIGCIFPKQMFYDLCKGWRMRIKVEDTNDSTESS